MNLKKRMLIQKKKQVRGGKPPVPADESEQVKKRKRGRPKGVKDSHKRKKYKKKR